MLLFNLLSKEEFRVPDQLCCHTLIIYTFLLAKQQWDAAQAVEQEVQQRSCTQKFDGTLY